MNIDTLINSWAKRIKEENSDVLILESETIDEANIPHDIETIKGSFNQDVSEERYAPTQRFLEIAYEMINSEFFGNKLPKDLIFNIKSAPRADFIGYASYRINRLTDTITPLAVILNSSRTLTLHEWLEVVLHEMVHITDYVENPDHFLGFMRKYYDAHGRWFLDYGERFKQFGFNVQKYCNANIGINTDDRRVKNAMNNYVFMILKGFPNGMNGRSAIIKISHRDIEKYKDIFSNGVSRGRFSGLKSLVLMKTENPQSVRLSTVRMKDSSSRLSYYYYDEKFEQKYGPFETIEEFDIYRMNEDKDEVDFEDMNHIDDEYARKMYDNIEGVIGVEKVEDGVYDVAIF